MAAVAAIAGVGMMVCCSSSVAALMMGGDGDDSSDSAAGAGAGAGAAAATLPSGQYVKLEQTIAYDASAMRDDGTTAGNDDDKHRILNLAELEVFAKGGTTSLAAGKTVTGTAVAASYPGANLVDGVMNNFSHTWGRDVNVKDEFTTDLGSIQEIEKIKITNRSDCCKNRAIGIKAIILGADGTTVIKETAAITTKADTYTFTFPGTAWA